VILLNFRVLDIEGINSSTESKFFLSSIPAFINNGVPSIVIRENVGKTPKKIPVKITKYEIKGNSIKSDIKEKNFTREKLRNKYIVK